VVGSGGGFYAWTLVGKRVAFTRVLERPGLFTKGGTYAEYCVTSATNCITLDDNVSFEQGASGVCNPLTALGLLERCKDRNAQAVIQTGAASQMGRMMIRLLAEENIPTINIVRKDDQVQMLKDKYAGPGLHVLNSESPTFEKDLKALARELNANVVLECVAGPIVGVISNCLPRNSTIVSYGQLSESKIEGISAFSVIGGGLKLEGFLLSNFLREKNIFQILSITKKARTLLGEVIINKEFGLHQIHEAMAEYKANMSKGKVLLKPSLTL